MLGKHIITQGILLRNACVVSRAAYHQAGGKHSTMSDLPVPKGDWQENYSRLNSKYNTVLIFGILSLAGTIALAKSLGIIELNASVPKLD